MIRCRRLRRLHAAAALSAYAIIAIDDSRLRHLRVMQHAASAMMPYRCRAALREARIARYALPSARKAHY